MTKDRDMDWKLGRASPRKKFLNRVLKDERGRSKFMY